MKGEYYYFEDYQVGQEGLTHGRTVSMADFVYFAGIAGDYEPVHLDRHFAASNKSYGERISHGWLVMSLVPGMISYRFPYIVGCDVPEAYLFSIEINYRHGLVIDNTIKVAWRVSEKTDDPAQKEFGLVKTTFQVLNQDGTLIDDGSITTKVRKKTAKDAKLQLKPEIPWEITKTLAEPDPERIYYLEDYVVGEGQQIGGHTITEADIVNFVGLTGDFNRLYTDVEFAAKNTFGERIAPGMLVAVVVSGLWVRKGFYIKSKKPPADYAHHLADVCTFLAPVKIGDTIHFQCRIGYTRVSKTKQDRGIMKLERQILNQRNEVVQDGYTLYMVGTKAAGA
jgi:3-hydroxybutyryl-CoA dehydratase